MNRNGDGSYRNIGTLLIRAGIFVPIPERSREYTPVLRYSNGTQRAVTICSEVDGTFNLPCSYTVSPIDGASGLYYSPLAFKFYHAYNKDDIELDKWIMQANILDGCKNSSPRLLPGTTVLIPMLP